MAAPLPPRSERPPEPPQGGGPKLPWGAGGDITTNQAIGSLRESLMMWLKDERGIHSETLLMVIGALAGFAGQCAAFERYFKKEEVFPGDAMVQLKTRSGEIFYSGDLINSFLIPQRWSEYPLWGFLQAAAIGASVTKADMPDPLEMFRYVASTLGSADAKVPRLPANHGLQLAPRQALEVFWPRARFIFTRTDGPGCNGRNVPVKLWPVVTGVVANQLLENTKQALDIRVGMRIVMETAIVMSKVDPKTVPQTPAQKTA
jgi:hypothetical protein